MIAAHDRRVEAAVCNGGLQIQSKASARSAQASSWIGLGQEDAPLAYVGIARPKNRKPYQNCARKSQSVPMFRSGEVEGAARRGEVTRA